jgi:hypothetical protein
MKSLSSYGEKKKIMKFLFRGLKALYMGVNLESSFINFTKMATKFGIRNFIGCIS